MEKVLWQHRRNLHSLRRGPWTNCFDLLKASVLWQGPRELQASTICWKNLMGRRPTRTFFGLICRRFTWGYRERWRHLCSLDRWDQRGGCWRSKRSPCHLYWSGSWTLWAWSRLHGALLPGQPSFWADLLSVGVLLLSYCHHRCPLCRYQSLKLSTN